MLRNHIDSVIEVDTRGFQIQTQLLNGELFERRTDVEQFDRTLPFQQWVVAISNPFDRPIRAVAPWSDPRRPEFQEGETDCVLAIPLKDNFQPTYNAYIFGDVSTLSSLYRPAALLAALKDVDARYRRLEALGSGFALDESKFAKEVIESMCQITYSFIKNGKM